MASHYGWCNCPHCPQNMQLGQPYNPNYLAMPTYQSTHQHDICAWCDLFAHCAPNFEGHPLYLKNMGTFEKIHSFFMGVPLAPYKVAEAIRGLAEEIEFFALRKAGYGRPKGKHFIRELLELADEVDGGGFYSYSAGTSGLGPRRALGFGHSRPRLGWRT